MFQSLRESEAAKPKGKFIVRIFNTDGLALLGMRDFSLVLVVPIAKSGHIVIVLCEIHLF